VTATDGDLGVVAARDGVLVRLRVRPGRPRTAVAGLRGGLLLLDVAAPPEKGRANREVVAWLAAALGVPRERVEVRTGHAAREKCLRVQGVEEDEVRRRLRALLPSRDAAERRRE
jgi:Uncharacterized conserved protein